MPKKRNKRSKEEPTGGTEREKKKKTFLKGLRVGLRRPGDRVSSRGAISSLSVGGETKKGSP